MMRVSYDFNAAIREFGQLNDSYQKLKSFHYFLNEFGELLAPTNSFFPETNGDLENLQYSVRANDTSAFLFCSNYIRLQQCKTYRNVAFSVKLKDEIIHFPKEPVEIKDSTFFIWPLNFQLNNIKLNYATAQPVCKIDNDGIINYFFFQNSNITSEFCFENTNILDIETSNGFIIEEDKHVIVTGFNSGLDCMIKMIDLNKNELRIIVLNQAETDNVWLFNECGRKQLFISDANLYFDGNSYHLFDYSNIMGFYAFPPINEIFVNGNKIKSEKHGIYSVQNINAEKKEVEIGLHKKQLLEDAKWLKTEVAQFTEKQQLWHRVFYKEFLLNNPSEIKLANLVFYSESDCSIKINKRWLNTTYENKQLNKIDVTGYVQKGGNFIMFGFLYAKMKGAFAAYLEVEYFNTDLVRIYTDESWLMKAQYLIPSEFRKIDKPLIPGIIERQNVILENVQIDPEWEIEIPENILDNVNNVYLKINYQGDIARCRLNDRLISDNYYDGTGWWVGLKNFENEIKGQKLNISIKPLKPEYDIYFENKPNFGDNEFADILDIEVIPEYKVIFRIIK